MGSLCTRLSPRDLLSRYSNEVAPQVDRIYNKLTETFENPSPTTDGIDRALESMELIAPFSGNLVPTKSYNLFRVVMQAPVSPGFPQEKKWEASRLTMRTAFRWAPIAWVEEPHDILTFLDHHSDLAIRGGENQDGPISDALRALGCSIKPAAADTLKHTESIKPSFARVFCYAYQGNRPNPLRVSALYLLPLMAERWFNTPDPVMEPDQMRSLCVDWASAVDRIQPSYDMKWAILEVLFGMISSPHWRPHIVTAKWKLLEYPTPVPDDSKAQSWRFPYDLQPLKRCLNNPELMDAIRKVESPDAMGLWLKILWLEYKDLIPRVREQLEMVTKEFAQGGRRVDLDTCLLVMDSESRKAEDGLTKYSSWSTDPAAIALRTKVDNLRQARVALVALKGD